MKVMKFGGSSVQDAAHIREAISIVQAEHKKEPVRAVICSAMKGVTDTLQSIASLAEKYDLRFMEKLQQLWNRHKTVIQTLLHEDKQEEVIHNVQQDYKELCEICHGVSLIKECSSRSMDLIMSFGERMNNKIIAAYARSQDLNVFYVDARELIRTNSLYGSAVVNFGTSYEHIQNYFAERGGIGIVTGFIASNNDGITTTLGRNGSDYSATIIGTGLGVDNIEIWTDVDGILEIDPRIVPNAGVIEELNLDEAMELSYFGAEVLHPSAISPAMEENIPVWIKNTLNPHSTGSKISAAPVASENVVTGLASIEHVTHLRIVGSGMRGMLNASAKILTALAKAEVHVLMLSQASSEQSINIVIRSRDLSAAVQSIHTDLEQEFALGILREIKDVQDLAIIAVIGKNMRGVPGVSGRIFKVLGDANINIFSIAQGSSEINISFAVKNKQRIASLELLHKEFFQNERAGN